MPRFILKVCGLYFEYSTIVDAPVTYPTTLEAFTAYYRRQYGALGRDFDLRMLRVERTGTSEHGADSWESTVKGNCAGPGESCLDPEAFRQWVLEHQQC